MQNVEYKAELRDLALARQICRAIRAPLVASLWQTDTYYKLASGRLKLRQTEGLPDEVIHYERDNNATARISKFTIYARVEADERFGPNPGPVWVVVRKMREVYMHDHVRIHLDQVENLGSFLEFEALVTPSHNLVKAFAAVESLRNEFAHAMSEAVSVSYSDLLAAQIEGPAEHYDADNPGRLPGL